MSIAKGRIPKVRTILSVRELTRDDLELLRPARTTPVVAKLRDPHHRLARLIASGLRIGEVVARSGYSYGRLAVLQNDPAFKELVAHYRNVVTEEFKESIDDYYDLAASNMLKAERQIAEKLEEADEAGELLPTKDLLAISRDAADRFGYGKKSTNVNVNVDFASQLEKAIARSGKTITQSAEPAPIRRRA